jgi:hypothetical protein
MDRPLGSAAQAESISSPTEARHIGQTYPVPVARRLRVYAFDPQSSISIDSAGYNVATIELPWEQPYEEKLQPGPVNDYLEIIDFDPVSGQLYEPVDLNNASVLARDGLDPSEGDPRFHQQMVFAVAMKTIRSFERALGRRIFWRPVWNPRKDNGRDKEGKQRRSGGYDPVMRLRVYPHALREANAYYSREKQALLFGYFPTNKRDSAADWVFTSLSHDIIAHETTHAILDGLHRRYAEPTSVDSLAFHEAFGDIVALLSHFTLGEAVREHILRNSGNLTQRSLLSGLARQFGNAQGRHGALREAIDRIDPADDRIDEQTLADAEEPHDRGAILVAAVFEAFQTIYRQRTADLMRIAGMPGTGTVNGAMNPDLATRLAREASKSADHVLRMCLRALDYLPPIDVRFGEFLRAIITADSDIIPNDRFNYRLAMIEAFRKRGIMPEGAMSLAPDSLRWEPPEENLGLDGSFPTINKEWIANREESFDAMENNRRLVHSWMIKSDENDLKWQRVCGVLFKSDSLSKWERQSENTVKNWPKNLEGGSYTDDPKDIDFKVEIHSVRTTLRIGPDGEAERQLIIEVMQRRRGFLVDERQEKQDQGESIEREDFIFRGGATLIFDLRTKKLRYAIRKSVANSKRLTEQREFLADNPQFCVRSYYSDQPIADGLREPFAFVHREA